jgi:hypothetical protein
MNPRFFATVCLLILAFALASALHNLKSHRTGQKKKSREMPLIFNWGEGTQSN